jgi:uncharacterized protein (DUF1778 family)
MDAAIKLERFAARIRPEEKRTLERAANLSGQSLTDFVISNALPAADEVIQRYEGMVLTSPRDREAFVAAMLAPPVPSDRLRAAARRYRAATEETA